MCLSTENTDDENASSRRHRHPPARPRRDLRSRPTTARRGPDRPSSSRQQEYPDVDPLTLDDSFFINDNDFPDPSGNLEKSSNPNDKSTKDLTRSLPNERHPREQHEFLQETEGASSRQTCRRLANGHVIETNGSYQADEGHFTFDRKDSIRREKDYIRIERDINTAWVDGSTGAKGKASQDRYHSIDSAHKDREVHHWKGRGHEETNTPGSGHAVLGYFSERTHEIRKR